MKVRTIFLESNTYTILLELFDNSVYNNIQIEIYNDLAVENGYSGVDDLIKSKPTQMFKIMKMFKEFAEQKSGGEINTDYLKNIDINEFKDYVFSRDARVMNSLSKQELALTERKKL